MSIQNTARLIVDARDEGWNEAVEACARAAEGTAPVAAGNFFAARRDQCAKAAAAIRTLKIAQSG